MFPCTCNAALQEVVQPDSLDVIIDSIEKHLMDRSGTARDLAIKGIAISQRLGNNLGAGICYKHLGASYYYLGRYADALENLSKAKHIFLDEKDDERRAQCLYDIGLLYSRMQYFDSAIAHLNRAQNLYIKNQDPTGPLFCLSEIGVLFFQNEDYLKALDYFNQAYEIGSAQQDTSEMVKNLGYIGGALMYSNQLNKAEKVFKENLKLCQEASYVSGKANGLNHLGVLYEKKGQFDFSRSFFFRNLRLLLKMDDLHHRATCQGNIGISHSKEGTYDSALYWTSRKLFLAKKLQDTVLLADALFAQSQFFAEKELMDSAFYTLNAYLGISEKLQDRSRIDLLENFSLKNELNDQGRELQAFENKSKLQQLEINQKNGLLIISLLSLGLLLTLGTFLIFYRQQKLKETKIHLELQLLRSRISPHNVFNAFNSIQSFFITQEYDKGLDYLRKFARLLRVLLEKSETPFHTISEELEYVKLYMDVEHLGMEKGFEFVIDLPDNIDIENTLIPPLISQTYLENAIQHGIFNLSTKGRIELRARMINEVLYWTITDNGIGIHQSVKHQNTAGRVHKSQGLELNKALLKTLSQGNNLNYTVTINELYSTQNVTGTEVILKLPQSN